MAKSNHPDAMRLSTSIANAGKSLLAGLMLSMVAVPGNAALIAVADMSIDNFGFVLQPPAGGGYSASTAQNGAIAMDTNLVAGPRTDFLEFDLTVDFGVRTEDWTVNVDTTASSPATIDTTSNEITIDLSTFNTDWSGIRCGATFPSCIDIAQGPAGAGTVTGAWNPVTHEFDISWQRIMPHPFPDGIGNWTLHGIANPVPVPGALVLFVSGALGLAALARRKIA